MADSCSQATPYWIYVWQETKHLSCRRDKTWVQHNIILRIIPRLHTLCMVLPPVYPKNCEPNICCTGEHSASQATPLLHELCCRSAPFCFEKNHGCPGMVAWMLLVAVVCKSLWCPTSTLATEAEMFGKVQVCTYFCCLVSLLVLFGPQAPHDTYIPHVSGIFLQISSFDIGAWFSRYWCLVGTRIKAGCNMFSIVVRS